MAALHVLWTRDIGNNLTAIVQATSGLAGVSETKREDSVISMDVLTK